MKLVLTISFWGFGAKTQIAVTKKVLNAADPNITEGPIRSF